MSNFHAGSIGTNNKVLKAPATDPALPGVAVVVSGVESGVPRMGYTDLPPLLRPVSDPTATSIVASYPDGSVGFMELDSIAAGAVGLNVLNVDIATTYTYFGGTKVTAWQINRYNNTTGERLKATIADNPAVTSYEEAWAARTVLTYVEITELDLAAGVPGDPGLIVSDTPPDNPEVLWLDTSVPAVDDAISLPLAGGTMDSGASILFANGSGIEESRDAAGELSNGLRFRCSVGYLQDWKEGRLWTYDSDNVTIRAVEYQSLPPSTGDNATLGYAGGSRWYTRDGRVFRCADAEAGTWVEEVKADFTRLTHNPVNGVPSSYELTGSITSNSGDPITLPLTYSYASENLWGGDGQVLQVVGNFWRLSVGDAVWNSDQQSDTLPENCTWTSTGINTGDPILTPSTELLKTTGQFALNETTDVLWQNLGNDETPNWVESPTLPIEQSDVTGLEDTLAGVSESIGVTQIALNSIGAASSDHIASTGNVHSLTAAQVRSILGVSTLSGNNTGDQDLSGLATTSAVAAGFVPRITSVDNRLTRFDETTGAVQGSPVTCDDSGNVTGVANLTVNNGSQGIINLGPAGMFIRAQPEGIFFNTRAIMWDNLRIGTNLTGTDIELITFGGGKVISRGNLEVDGSLTASGNFNGVMTIGGDGLGGTRLTGLGFNRNFRIVPSAFGQIELLTWSQSDSARMLSSGRWLFGQTFPTDDGTSMLQVAGNTRFIGNLTASGTVKGAELEATAVTFAGLPPASSKAGKSIQVSDRDYAIATSNGTNWLRAGTSTVLT